MFSKEQMLKGNRLRMVADSITRQQAPHFLSPRLISRNLLLIELLIADKHFYLKWAEERKRSWSSQEERVGGSIKRCSRSSSWGFKRVTYLVEGSPSVLAWVITIIIKKDRGTEAKQIEQEQSCACCSPSLTSYCLTCTYYLLIGSIRSVFIRMRKSSADQGFITAISDVK